MVCAYHIMLRFGYPGKLSPTRNRLFPPIFVSASDSKNTLLNSSWSMPRMLILNNI